MKYKLQDIIDIEQFQNLQDKLNEIYSFPSAIIDNDGNILTATAWQDICTQFHRKNKDSERHCIQSDQYILSHIQEANPAVTYRCPHGLVDNATPIIINSIHYGNFFTGQFFLEKPNMNFFRAQAKKYGFDEEAYLGAVRKVPIWTKEQLNNYLFFIKGLIAVISESGLKKHEEMENRKLHDLLLDLPVEIEADCVIHATGIVPDLPEALADQYGVSLDTFHFFKEADSKFRPVDSMNYRVFSCGLSLKPCTIEEAVASAEASAIRAIRILSHDHLISGKIVAATHTATCSLCEMCVDTCPYEARFVDRFEEKIVIDPAACQGCGVCATVCPSNSAFLEGFEGRQMLDIIDMVLS